MVRIKNRYLLVNILYPQDIALAGEGSVSQLTKLYQPTSDKLNVQVLTKAIRSGVSELFGDYGAGAISGSLQVKYLSPATSTFILKVSRAHYQIAWAALTFMDRIPDGKPCVFRVVRVSGTIRKAEEEAMRRSREMIIRARKEMGEQADANLDKLFGGLNDKSTIIVQDQIAADSNIIHDEEDEIMSDDG